MAITLVGTTQSGSFSGTSANSVTWPSTTVDDVIILLVSNVGTGVTFDTGNDAFTSIFNSVLATDDPRIVAGYHVIDGGEDGASFTYTSDSGPGSAYTAFALRGVDTANVIDVVGSAVSNTNTSTTAVTGVTTGTDGNWAIVFGSKSEASGNPSSWDNSFTELVEASIGSGGTGIAINTGYKEITTAGAVGTTTVSWGGGNDRNIGQMFSVNVASSGLTVNCTAASLAITENTQTVKQQRQLAATSASLTATEQTSTVSGNRTLAGTLATLTTSAQSATVGLSRELACTAATLTTTPFVASTGGARNISATLATLALSEQAATANLNRTLAGTLATIGTTTYQFTQDNTLTVDCLAASISLNSYTVDGLPSFGMAVGDDDWWRRRRIMRARLNERGGF